ncbi:MAG: hypothetical protein ACKVZJ_11420 [Phycisphaerales bacterium]
MDRYFVRRAFRMGWMLFALSGLHAAAGPGGGESPGSPGGPPIVIEPDLNLGCLPGDLNRDNVVNTADLVRFLGNFGKQGFITSLDGDLNRDRAINTADLVTFLANFGKTYTPEPPIPGVSFACSMDPVTKMITVVDELAGNAVVMSPSGCPAWKPYLEGAPPTVPLAPELELVDKPDGYDLVVNYLNTDVVNRSLGMLKVPGIRFGEDVQVRDFRFGGAPYTAHADFAPPPDQPPWACFAPQSYVCCGYEWPGDYYSPVAVISNGVYTIGASIQYPLLEYKHAVRIKYESFCWQHTTGGRNWELSFQLNIAGTYGRYNPEGDLKPGEKRTYIISVRIMKGDSATNNEWLRTLVPYREDYRCRYGGVRYQRDARPVTGSIVAIGEQLNFNHYGWTYGATRRPDTFGWGPWSSVWNGLYGVGWERQMVWAAAGLYQVNRHNNYPFQFTSNWYNIPAQSGSTAILDTLPVLAGMSQNRTREFGLWWGHAADWSPTWDEPALLPIVPYDNDPTDLEAAFTEIDGALDVNTTMIGLDALAQMPHWDSYWWVQDMQAHCAQRGKAQRLITEGRHSDLLHTLAPTYDVALNDALNGPLYRHPIGVALMDFLNPGHEIWGQMDQHRIQSVWGRPPTNDEMQDVMQGVAGRGIVPLNFMGVTITRPWSNFKAAPTWTTSVPADLRP